MHRVVKFFKTIKSHPKFVQFLEYNVGGLAYFMTGYAVFALWFSVFHVPWWLAKLLGDIVGWTINYIIQRYWAFQDKEFYKHEETNRLKYVVFTVFNLGIDYLLIGGLKHIGISPYIGMFIAAAFFTGWNYLGYRFWVFRKEYNKS